MEAHPDLPMWNLPVFQLPEWKMWAVRVLRETKEVQADRERNQRQMDMVPERVERIVDMFEQFLVNQVRKLPRYYTDTHTHTGPATSFYVVVVLIHLLGLRHRQHTHTHTHTHTQDLNSLEKVFIHYLGSTEKRT